jgi:hypothetical protein
MSEPGESMVVHKRETLGRGLGGRRAKRDLENCHQPW